ncbi:MAG TPA: hypothetical protein VMM60_02020 [Ilumatobacter sp.]|nr:hypothetical protein [Ilumatobacter sp.]
MTISKGAEWGEPVTRAADLPVVTSDAALAAHDPDAGAVGLAGGDIFRSVGSPEPRTDSMRLPLDRLAVTFDRQIAVAVAHVVLRRTGPFAWWRGELLAICNADFVGRWNVAPRAHPNDGRFDALHVTKMSLRDRWAAKARLPQGTHVPHPGIAVRTATDASWEFAHPMRITIDGVDRGTCTQVRVAIEPDALAIIV